MPSLPRRVPWSLGSLLLLLPAPALAQGSVPCPLDGTRIRLPPPASWNAGGGVDSDGCRYGLAPGGARRVLGLQEIVSCLGCGASFRRSDLPLQLDPAEGERLGAALREALGRLGVQGQGTAELTTLPAGLRHELAAITYGVLGLERFGRREDPEGWRATLLLRAAWAARERAVGRGPDGGYRPQDPAEARRFLAALEARADADPRRDSRVLELDERLLDLDAARRAEAERALSLPLLRRNAARMRREQALLGQKRERLSEMPQEEPELELALVRALVRAGARGRWEARLERLGPAKDRELLPLREALQEEARLLALAGPAFAAAAAGAAPAERARLLYLAGDAARRLGQDAEARDLFAQARKADPDSRAARWSLELER